jgi:A/G-specific adenine glycosylase
MKKPQKEAAFGRSMWSWNALHKRTLPWRDLKVKDDTQRAYMILVSEIMLQQTQVPRVIVIFKQFLEKFPTLKDLANASNKEVILAWRGMGYNSRALRLRDAAKIVLDEYGGKFPKEMKELLAIKGIGPYTAGAIRNFAFNIPTPCIDTNIRRIIHRVFIGPEGVDEETGKEVWKKNDRELLPLAADVLTIALDTNTVPKDYKLPVTGSAWHAALMDFGSAVCKKISPQCEICPMKDICNSAFKVKKIARKKIASKESGRFVGAKFIPNRIFRGRIVEQLRDAHTGLTVDQIGPLIAIDWMPEEHRLWLQELLEKLVMDRMIQKNGKRYRLAE